MNAWEEIIKDGNLIHISKENPFSYKFIKVNKCSKKVSHGIVHLQSFLVNPILIELNYKEKLADSIEYVLLVLEYHGFSRYTKQEKTFESKETLECYVKSLKM